MATTEGLGSGQPDEFEWGVANHRSPLDPHRWCMNEAEARAWIADWNEDGGSPTAFVLIRRRIGSWEVTN